MFLHISITKVQSKTKTSVLRYTMFGSYQFQEKLNTFLKKLYQMLLIRKYPETKQNKIQAHVEP